MCAHMVNRVRLNLPKETRGVVAAAFDHLASVESDRRLP